MQTLLKYKIWNLLPIVALMWIVEIIDFIYFNAQLDNFGIKPRDINGLWGILFAPFLHADFVHLIANTFPLIILGTLILIRSVEEFWITTFMIMSVGGVGIWVFGQPSSSHIGASILVFGYIGFLILRGYLEASSNAILTSIIVLFLYGGNLIYGVLPTDLGVSWEGHLLGFIGGLLAAHAVSKA